MDGFPSGQRERTVNPLSQTTMVRIHPRPPFFLFCGNGGIGRRVRFRSVWGQLHAGSSPVSRTIKETSFVYQDKRGFFLLSEQNKGRIIEKRALERSTGYSEARFLRSAAKEYRNHCCTNRISLLCKQLLNVFRVWDLNLMFAKNPVRVMI